MAKAIITIEDISTEGTKTVTGVKLDLRGKIDRDSTAHQLAVTALEGLKELIERELHGRVEKLDCPCCPQEKLH